MERRESDAEWFDRVQHTRTVAADASAPVTQDEYDAYKKNWEAEGFYDETDEQRAERLKLMEEEVIGVETFELDVVDGERLRGEGIDALLPEEEFARKTTDW